MKLAYDSMKTSTSQIEDYDVVILGSGAAGKLLSWTLGKKGMRIAAIERKYVGGSCPNIACLPSKNLIHSAKVASYFRRSEEFGITKDNWKVNMEGVGLDRERAGRRRESYEICREGFRLWRGPLDDRMDHIPTPSKISCR